ncbi:hypothetical protein SELMODRAFT_419347 [Selaginella moellendorffii]|uniref:F-box domain-containing protein n=1 Tax=Selaginella moellendorffii TaxID=88036 RepID=D8S8M3_SELML|nr:hypothetical protein SELMODRAFT_419347 [Selaginella moellendorffii]
MKRILCLPEEVLEAIFLRLPISGVIKVRSVCKHWRKLVNLPSFTELFSDSGVISWDAIIMDSSTTVMHWGGHEMYSATFRDNLVIAAHNKRYYIGNPFLGSWEAIPEVQDEMVQFDSVCIKGHEGYYKLVAWGFHNRVWTFSRGQSCWVEEKGLPRSLASTPVVFDDKVVSINIDKESLTIYDTKTWQAHLLVWEKKLFVVATEDEDLEGKIKIWDITRDEIRLEAEKVIADEVCVSYIRQHFDFRSKKSYLCFRAFTPAECEEDGDTSSQEFCYNLDEKVWEDCKTPKALYDPINVKLCDPINVKHRRSNMKGEYIL